MESIDLLRFKKKHRKKKIVGIFMTIVFLILGSSFLSFKMFYLPREINTQEGFLAGLAHLVLSPEKNPVSDKNTINILFLGMGGLGHEGPFLTDTMLLATINKKDKKMAMISIPRDLLVDTNKYGKQKINHINSFAEVEKLKSGGKYTKDVLEELLGVPIDYYVRMDFKGFRDIIDAVGGVDIDVPRTFIDPLFPREEIESENNPSETITVTFEKGIQHMDGTTALTYARSRHGNNGEGSDFARSRRQQEIILAIKDKILSSETLLSASKLKKIISALDNHLVTDISVWEGIQLATTYKDLGINTKDISINILTNGPNGPLYSDYYENQYVLLPKKPDWSDIRNIARDPFDKSIKQYTGNYEKTGDISLLVLNGTGIGGLANITAITLEDFGYKILDIANSPQKGFEKTVIYNITPQEKTDALKEIKTILAANIAQTIPDWLKDEVLKNKKPDFIIITGQSENQIN